MGLGMSNRTFIKRDEAIAMEGDEEEYMPKDNAHVSDCVDCVSKEAPENRAEDGVLCEAKG